MIKAKIADLYPLSEALASFIVDYSDVVMGKASVILHYNFRVLHDSLNEYLSERDNIITKYGKKDENGNAYVPADDEENVGKAIKEINEIGDIQIEVPLVTIPMEDLYKVADSVPASRIAPLIWMTTEYQETLKTDDPADEAKK